MISRIAAYALVLALSGSAAAQEAPTPDCKISPAITHVCTITGPTNQKGGAVRMVCVGKDGKPFSVYVPGAPV